MGPVGCNFVRYVFGVYFLLQWMWLAYVRGDCLFVSWCLIVLESVVTPCEIDLLVS